MRHSSASPALASLVRWLARGPCLIVCGCHRSRGLQWSLLARDIGVAICSRRCRRRVLPGYRNFHLFPQRVFQFVPDVLILFQEVACILASLAHALATIAKPRAGLFENTLIHAKIDQVAFARNAFAIKNVELRLAERRSHLVLHYLRARPRTHHAIAILNGLD